MELINYRQQRIEKWVLKSCKGLFCLVAGGALALMGHFLFEDKAPPISTPVSSVPSTSKIFLGEGPLALSARSPSPPLQSVLQQLILVGASTRPDQDHDQQLTLALRSSGEQKKVSIGETVFLRLKEGSLEFSTEASNIAFLPCSFDHERVLCKFYQNPSEENLLQEQFTLVPSPIFSRSLEQESYVETLKKGGLWSSDVFLSGWGGEEYRDLTKKVKISIHSDVFFLRPGDCLWWDGDHWTEQLLSEKPGPIAQLMQISSQGADFKVWDETGFSSGKTHLAPQTSSQAHFKIEELMTAIRPRASSEITCQLGKRRVIVKEGDWWVRMDNRWKQVRTAADLDALLHHQLAGELFIFEKVEASKGKIILKGRAFDRMRTSSEAISLVVQSEKKNFPSTSKSSKGNPAFLAKNRSSRSTLSNSAKESGGL